MRRARSLAPLLALALLLLPFYLALAASLSPESRLFEGPVLAPWPPRLDHYAALLSERRFWLPLRNSLVVAGATTLLCLALASPFAYALARLRFRGRRALLAAVLAVSMFPQISIVSPLYLLLRTLGLLNSVPGLVLPYTTFTLPLTVWLLLSFFRQLPEELEDAARVDGASRLRAFFEIALPLSAPALAATAIIAFIYCWNEFLFALSFTVDSQRHTVPVAVALFRGQYRVPWGQILAAAVVATAPVVALVLLFQRRIAQGLVSGAVKG